MKPMFTVIVDDLHSFKISKDQLEQFDLIPSKDKLHVIENGVSISAEITDADFLNRKYSVKVNGNRYHVRIENELDALIAEMGLAVGENTVANEIHAPMPGLIIEVSVAEGQEVKKGASVCVLEAMKMENALMSPRNGIIKALHISKGNTVDKGDLLIEFES